MQTEQDSKKENGFNIDQQYPNWCFTLHYNEVDYKREDAINCILKFKEKGIYCIAGAEVAPTTGAQHLQGYIQLRTKSRLGQLVKHSGTDRIHWEAARGDEESNTAYCSKGGDIAVRWGEPRITDGGKREGIRWDLVRQYAKSGEHEKIDDHAYIVYCRNIDYIYQKNRPKQDTINGDLRHMWIYGPTGTGKSRSARTMLQNLVGDDWYLKQQNKWWDHYNKEEMVLIDDLEKEWARLAIHHIKQWLDRYPFNAEVKGNVIQHVRPKQFIITSNYHPYEIWGDHLLEWYQPIMRRIQVVFQGNPGQDEPDFEKLAKTDYDLIQKRNYGDGLLARSNTIVSWKRSPEAPMTDESAEEYLKRCLEFNKCTPVKMQRLTAESGTGSKSDPIDLTGESDASEEEDGERPSNSIEETQRI